MPPGVINHSIPVLGLHWWSPAGFFRKKAGVLKYARVWRCDGNACKIRKIDDAPVGIIATKHLDPDGIWIKVGWKWISSNSEADIFVRVDVITKPEYETDLAFGLFKKLLVTNRPIRSWFKNNRRRVRGWHMIATLAATVSCFQILANTKELWDQWFIVGSLATLFAGVSMLWLFWTAKGRGKK
jgi:hypothetical protein